MKIRHQIPIKSYRLRNQKWISLPFWWNFSTLWFGGKISSIDPSTPDSQSLRSRAWENPTDNSGTERRKKKINKSSTTLFFLRDSLQHQWTVMSLHCPHGTTDLPSQIKKTTKQTRTSPAHTDPPTTIR